MPPQPSARRRAHLVLALGALAGVLLFLLDGLAHASAPRPATAASLADPKLQLLRELGHQRALWPD